MSEEIRRKFSIPDNHTLKQVSADFKGPRKGSDDDEYTFQQLDENGQIVAIYTEIHSTSTYPPFNTSIHLRKH